MAEEALLKSVQCRFESDSGHMTTHIYSSANPNGVRIIEFVGDPGVLHAMCGNPDCMMSSYQQDTVLCWRTDPSVSGYVEWICNRCSGTYLSGRGPYYFSSSTDRANYDGAELVGWIAYWTGIKTSRIKVTLRT